MVAVVEMRGLYSKVCCAGSPSRGGRTGLPLFGDDLSAEAGEDESALETRQRKIEQRRRELVLTFLASESGSDDHEDGPDSGEERNIGDEDGCETNEKVSSAPGSPCKRRERGYKLQARALP